jgi:predicted XRE-type DNA-binding protein
MAKQQTGYTHKWSYVSLQNEVEIGAMNPKTAIYHAVAILVIDLSGHGFFEFIRWFKVVVKRVEWGDGKTVHTTTGLYWDGLKDCLSYIDVETGGTLQMASWFVKHEDDSEADFEKASESKAKQLARQERAKELHEQGATQQQIADELGVSQQTVSRDLLKKSVYTQKMSKQPRKVVQYKISQYTDPKTAAQKIRATFGDDFAEQLCDELQSNF